MKGRNVAIGLTISAMVAFVFFAPVVFVGPAFPVSGPVYYMNYPTYGSISYWTLGIGGIWMFRGYYTLIL